MPQEICILSTQRSGTNYVCSLWWSLKKHWCFYELFSPEAVFGAEDFLVDLGSSLRMNVTTIQSKDLLEYAHRQPNELLDRLSTLVSKKGINSLSYKIFPNHLDDYNLQSILRRKGLKVVLIERHPIDVYISLQKAQTFGSWINVPTTELTVELDFDDFLKWRSETADWFRHIEESLNDIGKQLFKLRYETDIRCRPEHHLDLIYRSLFDPSECPAEIVIRENTLIEKQDRSSSYDRKVLNWAAFCSRARELEKLDTFFVY